MKIVKIILKVNFFESDPFPQNPQNSENGRHPLTLQEAAFNKKNELFLEKTILLRILTLSEYNRHYERRLFRTEGVSVDMVSQDILRHLLTIKNL